MSLNCLNIYNNKVFIYNGYKLFEFIVWKTLVGLRQFVICDVSM